MKWWVAVTEHKFVKRILALNLSVLLQLTVKLKNVLIVTMQNVFKLVLEHKFVKGVLALNLSVLLQLSVKLTNVLTVSMQCMFSVGSTLLYVG